MTEYSCILFDLDGTLTEPKEGITKCIQYALRKMGLPDEDEESLCRFIGPPLIPAFCEEYGMTRQEAMQAVLFYRERFLTKGMYENEVYPGISDLLSALKKCGKTLLVATTKPEPQAVDILRHFELLPFFDFVAGSTLEETRVDKGEVIAYALEGFPHIRKESVLMVGDRKYDVLGAKQNHVAFLGVLYGHGSEAELKDAGATYMVQSVEMLRKALIG